MSVARRHAVDSVAANSARMAIILTVLVSMWTASAQTSTERAPETSRDEHADPEPPGLSQTRRTPAPTGVHSGIASSNTRVSLLVYASPVHEVGRLSQVVYRDASHRGPKWSVYGLAIAPAMG